MVVGSAKVYLSYHPVQSLFIGWLRPALFSLCFSLQGLCGIFELTHPLRLLNAEKGTHCLQLALAARVAA